MLVFFVIVMQIKKNKQKNKQKNPTFCFSPHLLSLPLLTPICSLRSPIVFWCTGPNSKIKQHHGHSTTYKRAKIIITNEG